MSAGLGLISVSSTANQNESYQNDPRTGIEGVSTWLKGRHYGRNPRALTVRTRGAVPQYFFVGSLPLVGPGLGPH